MWCRNFEGPRRKDRKEGGQRTKRSDNTTEGRVMARTLEREKRERKERSANSNKIETYKLDHSQRKV